MTRIVLSVEIVKVLGKDLSRSFKLERRRGQAAEKQESHHDPREAYRRFHHLHG
jgi:hypothetical protein